MTVLLRRPFKDWIRAFWGVFQRMDDLNLALIAAGVAFYGLLGLFPGIAAVISIWSLGADPEAVQGEIALLKDVMPPEAYTLLEEQVTKVISASSETLSWAGLVAILTALWSTRAGVSALIRGLNTIYDVPNRKGLSHYFWAFAITLVLISVALSAMALVVAVPIVVAYFPPSGFTAFILGILRWVAALGVLLVGLAVVYRFGPNRRLGRMRWLTPGGLLSVVIWGLASFLFSYFLANFGNYNEIYGSLGAVIALLMWLYLSAYVILFGAAFNVEMEARAGLAPGASDIEPDDEPPASEDDDVAPGLT